MKKLILILSLIAIFITATAVLIEGAERGGRRGGPPNVTLGTPVSTMLNINRVASWYSANGEQERNPFTTNSGLYYPRGTSTAIYSAGLVWGGTFNDGRTPALRVNGQSYNNGTKPGAIVGIRTGVAEDAAAADVRIYRVRRDYATADLKQDAAEINSVGLNNVTDAQIAAVRAQYARDWTEWPWRKGAPFYDNGYIGPNGRDTLGRNNKTLDWGEDTNQNGVLDSGEDANSNGKLDGETPGLADADQVIWYVCNDIGVNQPWACPETGMEEQATIWGYNRTDAIGNVIFKRFRLIYKGIAATPANATIQNMYMCQWSDPDLGNSGDDYSGCDTVLSMAYVYNANPADNDYAQFRLVPPASGYDFLQGPLVFTGNPNDTAAIFDLKRRGPGYRNLPMTSSLYFAAGGTYSDPPFNYNGAIQWYQMLRGLPPTPQGPPDPAPLVNPTTGQPTGFWLSGDPVNRTGWLDGRIDNPGDRRILLSAGPFNMAVGDTQELVSAWVGGLGNSNISSIKVMKFNDKSVQLAYDNLFSLPKPPVNPKVQVTALDRTILLDWGADAATVSQTEVPVYLGGYRFEGYKIYQLPSASSDLSSAIFLAEYDVNNGVRTIIQETFDTRSGEVLFLPVQFGTDNGIQRKFSITEDKIRGGPLVNGQRFYFAVTAYNYTADDTKPIRTLESSPLILTIIPEKPKPGTRYPFSIGDTVAFADVVGRNDAVIVPVVYNPTRPKGYTYNVRFDTAGGTTRWSLTNATTGATLFSNVTDLSGASSYEVQESGFSVSVVAPPQGVRTVRDARGRNAMGVNALTASDGYAVLGSSGTPDTVISRFTDNAYEIRFDAAGGWALSVKPFPAPRNVAIKVPFSVWDVGRSTSDTPRRLIPVLSDSGNTPDRWNTTPNGVPIQGTVYRVFEPMTITALPYPTSNDSASIMALQSTLVPTQTNPNNTNTLVYKLLLADLDLNGLPPSDGNTIRLTKYIQIRSGDTKSITLTAVTSGNTQLARQDIQDIKAFPNPYYGVNRAETDRVNRFITFSHLPDRAKIRIFNLAGVLVRELEKNDLPNANQFLNWDLQNTNGLPAASGIYIVYIEMPDLNVTKTIKVAIIQEQQFLRNY